MFRRIISRDAGVPWPETGMRTEDWKTILCEFVKINELTATQPAVLLFALTEEGSWCGDEYPHVIEWQGEMYLEDGHHRAMRALLLGQETMRARVLRLG